MRIWARRVFLDDAFVSARLEISAGRISSAVIASEPSGDDDLVFEHGFLIPGLIDLQINGAFGADFSSSTQQEIAHSFVQVPATGTTSICPTVITSDSNLIRQQVSIINSMHLGKGAARNLGVHLEGPFISPLRRGAHQESQLLDFPEGTLPPVPLRQVRLITLAPEIQGANRLIEQALSAGVIVSLGHSDANAAEANLGFESGASMVTHIFNAMRPLHHRDPGLAGAALAHPDISLGFIADGVHIDYLVVKIILQAGGDRPILVSDASAALLCAPGTKVMLGGEVIYVDEAGHARRTDGTLASSGLTQLQAIERAVSFGLSREELLRSASKNPARKLGLNDLGHISVGAKADLVHYLVEPDLKVDWVMIEGEECLAL
jgi:N-acetylglucosamine-6-phosphate deacetylase